jgi:hypothetical protein
VDTPRWLAAPRSGDRFFAAEPGSGFRAAESRRRLFGRPPAGVVTHREIGLPGYDAGVEFQASVVIPGAG